MVERTKNKMKKFKINKSKKTRLKSRMLISRRTKPIIKGNQTRRPSTSHPQRSNPSQPRSQRPTKMNRSLPFRRSKTKNK